MTEFVIDLNSNPQRWESFFPSDAMGKKIEITIYKNDLEDLTIKELQGLYSPQPVLI